MKTDKTVTWVGRQYFSKQGGIITNRESSEPAYPGHPAQEVVCRIADAPTLFQKATSTNVEPTRTGQEQLTHPS